MPLNFDVLKSAVDALARAVDIAENEIDNGSDDLKDVVRSGVIQNFEVAYEQSWKMIQRWIKENKTPAEADNPRTRKDLFRSAAKFGLINDPSAWFAYGESRNETTHTYDRSKAASVYSVAKAFVADARVLVNQLEQMND